MSASFDDDEKERADAADPDTRPAARHGESDLESEDAMTSLSVLADVLYREEVARARATTPGEKLLEGPRLFDRAYRIMADGIRHRCPDLGDGPRSAVCCTQRLSSRRILGGIT